MPQSRLGTAGNMPIVGVGANTNIDIVNRPVTNQGLGINNMGSNPGRQVYDRNYYLNKLKERLQLIYGEIENFKKKGDEITKEQHIYNKLENRFEELRKEVRNLEGQLADYNLTIDKIRVNTRPEDVHNAYVHVRAQNEKFKTELDQVFLERKQYEEGIDDIQGQLQNIHEQMELRLNELDPSQRSEYQKLINENKDLIAEYNVRQRDLEELNSRLATAEARLRMDSQKLKGQLLKNQIGELEGKKGDLEIQLNEANLSIPEARDRILARMKEDNTTIATTEKRSREVKKNIEMCEKRLRELEASLLDKKTEEEDKKKYEILYQKDKEMDEFINSFDKMREKDVDEMATLQERITELLEQVTKILEIAGQLPTKEVGASLRADKTNTLAQAKTEYEVRLGNLRGLENAEERTGKVQQFPLRKSRSSMSRSRR